MSRIIITVCDVCKHWVLQSESIQVRNCLFLAYSPALLGVKKSSALAVPCMQSLKISSVGFSPK